MAEYNPYEQICLNSLKSCIKTVKKTNTFIVDIGSSFNSWFLDFPFVGLLIDMDLKKILSISKNNLYTKICSKITTSNVWNILEKNQTPKDFFILNIDIDGPDLFILIKLLQKYQPKIIITEINEKIPYPVKFSIIDNPNFDWGWCHLYGYSIACLEDLMLMFNYSIFSLNMNNIILIKNDKSEKPNIDKIEEFYKKGYLNNTVIPPPGWNDDVKHLHDCKTKEEVAIEWRKYFLKNKNPNNGKDQTGNLNKYVINESYKQYLKKWKEKHG